MAQEKNAEGIFCKAVEIPNPTEQAEYVYEACAGDEKLRTEVNALLKWHEEAGDFLEGPANNLSLTLEESPLLAGEQVKRGMLPKVPPCKPNPDRAT